MKKLFVILILLIFLSLFYRNYHKTYSDKGSKGLVESFHSVEEMMTHSELIVLVEFSDQVKETDHKSGSMLFRGYEYKVTIEEVLYNPSNLVLEDSLTLIDFRSIVTEKGLTMISNIHVIKPGKYLLLLNHQGDGVFVQNSRHHLYKSVGLGNYLNVNDTSLLLLNKNLLKKQLVKDIT